MIIRDARMDDINAIGIIWNHYIRNTTFNWRHEEYTNAQMQRWFSQHGTPDRPVLVVEEGSCILGFGALSAFRDTIGYRYTAEDTIYLAPQAKRRGLGTLLMRELLQRGKDSGLWQVVAMIDGNNAPSIEFHERMGFVSAGMLRGIGEKNGERLDCVIMQRSLD